MAHVLKKLEEWKAQPYHILDEVRIEELIQKKIEEVADTLAISKDLAYSFLVKQNWDVESIREKAKLTRTLD